MPDVPVAPIPTRPTAGPPPADDLVVVLPADGVSPARTHRAADVGGPAVEQRVVVDQPASAATVDKINLHAEEAELTITDVQGGTAPTVVFADYVHANYLGARLDDPDAASYQVEQWFFQTLKHRPRVDSDLDPITPGEQKGWLDATFEEVIGPGTVYLGEFPADAAAAAAPGVAVGALFFHAENEALRVVTRITPGAPGRITHLFKRLVTTLDLRYRDRDIAELEQARASTAQELASIEARIDALVSAPAGAIPDNSLLPIKAQADTDEHQKNWRTRLGASRVSAGIALPTEAASGTGDVFFFTQDVAAGLAWRDLSDLATVINAAAAGDVGLFLGRHGWTRLGNVVSGNAALMALIEALTARVDNLGRNVTMDPWVRDRAVNPDPRTVIVHVPADALPAGTTHLALVISGVPATSRAEVENSGAYSFTFASASVANISTHRGSTAIIDVGFYAAANGGVRLGHAADLIRLLDAPAVNYAVYPIQANLQLPAVGANPATLGYGAAIRSQGAGIARAAGSKGLTLAAGTYELFLQTAFGAATTDTGRSRVNLRVLIENATSGVDLDDQRPIGYVRNIVDLATEGVLSHHLLTLDAETTIRIGLAQFDSGGGQGTVTTAAGGRLTIRRL